MNLKQNKPQNKPKLGKKEKQVKYENMSNPRYMNKMWFVIPLQGRIQTGNGSVQELWAPKKMSLKMKKIKAKLLLSDKFLSFPKICSNSYTAKKKWLKVCKTM